MLSKDYFRNECNVSNWHGQNRNHYKIMRSLYIVNFPTMIKGENKKKPSSLGAFTILSLNISFFFKVLLLGTVKIFLFY